MNRQTKTEQCLILFEWGFIIVRLLANIYILATFSKTLPVLLQWGDNLLTMIWLEDLLTQSMAYNVTVQHTIWHSLVIFIACKATALLWKGFKQESLIKAVIKWVVPTRIYNWLRTLYFRLADWIYLYWNEHITPYWVFVRPYWYDLQQHYWTQKMYAYYRRF